MFQKMKIIGKLHETGKLVTALEYVKICRFRNFEKDLTVRFDHPFTVLVGKNGSGKSTFLKLLKSIAKGKTPDDYFFETEWDQFNDEGTSEFQYKMDGVRCREFKVKKSEWKFSELPNDFDQNKEINGRLENFSIKSYKRVVDIEFKSLIGVFEKNTFFDNQTSSLNLKSKADYARRVTKKVQQSIDTKHNGGKKSKAFSSK